MDQNTRFPRSCQYSFWNDAQAPEFAFKTGKRESRVPWLLPALDTSRSLVFLIWGLCKEKEPHAVNLRFPVLTEEFWHTIWSGSGLCRLSSFRTPCFLTSIIRAFLIEEQKIVKKVLYERLQKKKIQDRKKARRVKRKARAEKDKE